MRFNPTLTLLGVSVLGLAACTPGETVLTTPTPLTEAESHFARSAMASRLRDPASAQFQDIVAYALPDGGRIICGQLNARNGFGGYNGFSPFFMRLRGREVVRVYHDDATGYGAAFIGCSRAAEGQIALSG